MAALLATVPALAAPQQSGSTTTTTFVAKKGGEALLDLTASAPGTDWGKTGSESAVVTVTLDGKYNQDVVLFAGEQRFTYQLALGTVSPGRHTVEVSFNPEKSPAGATGAQIHNLSIPVVSAKDPAALAYQYSPILYGRDLPEIPGQYENNYTDVPLLMYQIEANPKPSTPEVSDQRNYLYIEIDKDTTYATPPAPGNWVGTAIAVKLKGDHRWYTSNHDIPDWSIQRDIPAATTVELPPGTTAADIEAIKVFAVPVDSNPNDATPAPNDYTIHFTYMNRAFFLDSNYLPGSSFIDWSGDVVLTPQNSEAVVWQNR